MQLDIAEYIWVMLFMLHFMIMCCVDAAKYERGNSRSD